jgi:serine/threonine protein kinase
MEQYHVLKKMLGTGASSEVRLGFDRAKRQLIACKLLTQKQKHESLCRAEERVLRRLDHKNIVKLYNVDNDYTDGDGQRYRGFVHAHVSGRFACTRHG